MIQAAKLKDIAELAEFASAMFTHTFGHLYSAADLQHHIDTTCSEAYFTAQMARDGVCVDVIRHADTIIAYAKYGALNLPVGRPVLPCIEIHRLYVDPKCKRGGLGSRLMVHMENYARSQAAKVVYLGVYSDNVAAQAFYQRYDFDQVGAYDYYVGDHIDHEFIFMKALESV